MSVSLGEMPTRLFSDVQIRTFQAAAGLMTRRSQAVTDFLRALPEVRQPGDLLALQLGYCTRMLDDYAGAVTESLGAFGEPEGADAAVAAAPQAEAPAEIAHAA